MTRYEELMYKANCCLERAKQTEGFMSAVWERNWRELEKQAKNLSFEEANKKVCVAKIGGAE